MLPNFGNVSGLKHYLRVGIRRCVHTTRASPRPHFRLPCIVLVDFYSVLLFASAAMVSLTFERPCTIGFSYHFVSFCLMFLPFDLVIRLFGGILSSYECCVFLSGSYPVPMLCNLFVYLLFKNISYSNWGLNTGKESCIY